VVCSVKFSLAAFLMANKSEEFNQLVKFVSFSFLCFVMKKKEKINEIKFAFVLVEIFGWIKAFRELFNMSCASPRLCRHTASNYECFAEL